MDSFIMLTDYYMSRLKKAKLDDWVEFRILGAGEFIISYYIIDCTINFQLY